MEYNNKAQISEPGSYLFELSVLEGQDRPVKEQTVYKAVYHFRIEEKEPETQAAVEAGSFGDRLVLEQGFPARLRRLGQRRLPIRLRRPESRSLGRKMVRRRETVQRRRRRVPRRGMVLRRKTVLRREMV